MGPEMLLLVGGGRGEMVLGGAGVGWERRAAGWRRGREAMPPITIIFHHPNYIVECVSAVACAHPALVLGNYTQRISVTIQTGNESLRAAGRLRVCVRIIRSSEAPRLHASLSIHLHCAVQQPNPHSNIPLLPAGKPTSNACMQAIEMEIEYGRSPRWPVGFTVVCVYPGLSPLLWWSIISGPSDRMARTVCVDHCGIW
ncbi:hypothetical protein JOQ06_029288, partial [Pogonophryne albipinna]